MAFDVFISYPHQEKAIADAACARLEAGGIRCWIAPRDIAPSADWAASIVDAIDQCRVMVLIFSGHTNRSRQVHREVQQAFDKEKPVLPFRIEEVIPDKSLSYYMSSVHWLDALSPPLEKHIEKLAASVEVLVREPPTEPGLEAAPASGKLPTENSGLRRSALSSRLALASGSVIGLVVLGAAGFWFMSATPKPVAVAPKPAPTKATTVTPESALPDIIQAAQRGDPAAQNALGVKYATGAEGLPHDDVHAVDWYKKAAVQGYPGAETNLGDMYLFGRGGLDKNALEALSWYLKAAQQQWPDAQYRLGFMYETGLGTEKNVQRAVANYRSAAEAGYADAENLLGILYATGGDDLQRDDKQAVEWFRKAAEQGFAKAQKNLGDMYFFGRGVERDYKQATFWYTKAADQDFAEAQYRLGYMYENGQGTDRNEKQAAELYQKAARNGSVDARRALDRLQLSPPP